MFCCISPLCAQSSLNNDFLPMFRGNFCERNKERESFRPNRLPNMEEKLSFTLFKFCDLNQRFFAAPGRQSKKTTLYHWIVKNEEPDKRNVRFRTLALMFISHDRQVKCPILPWNTRILIFFCFVVIWCHPQQCSSLKMIICHFMVDAKFLRTRYSPKQAQTPTQCAAKMNILFCSSVAKVIA